MSDLAGAPILCRRCGAPCDVAPDASLRCRHCGAIDRLPTDELGRALEIRGRLVVAASRVAQVSGTERAVAGIFEGRRAFFTLMGPWPILALLITASAAWNVHETLSALPPSVPASVRTEIIVAAAYGPLFVIGIALSFPMALIVGRMSYRGRTRTQLLARPPLGQGAPMRCRACGGDLPSATDAFVTCRYCRTQNLVTAATAEEVKRRIEEEIAEHRARANGMYTATAKASSRMTRTLFVSFALVYVGVIALGMIARVMIG
ncbi:hypothetical protein BH09MYX1_BH09MYX1_50620 [soil metagenome]